MKFCANVSILFKEVPFLERFERAARAGSSPWSSGGRRKSPLDEVEAAIKASAWRSRCSTSTPASCPGDRGLLSDRPGAPLPRERAGRARPRAADRMRAHERPRRHRALARRARGPARPRRRERALAAYRACPLQHRERETQRQTERERETERDTETERERETQRQERERERHRDRERKRERREETERERESTSIRSTLSNECLGQQRKSRAPRRDER